MAHIRLISFLVLLHTIFCSSAFANWHDFKRQGDIVYILYESPAIIKRYNLSTESFLADLTFESQDATAFHVDSDGIYIAFDRNLSRYSLTGTNKINLGNTSSTISEIVSSDTHIYAHYQRYLRSISKSNNQEVASKEFFYGMGGLSYSNIKERLYARTTSVSPSDILYIDLPNDGTLPSQYPPQTDSPYHGDYPNAAKTFIFPNEQRVVDDSGVIYTTDALTYVASLAGSFDDLAFYGDSPILLRSNELVSYSASNLETGSKEYPSQNLVKNISVKDTTVFGFYVNNLNQPAVIKTDVSELDPDEPGEPISPIGLNYDPDDIIAGRDGVIYILSKSNLSIFRWSIESQQYLSTIPLINVPNYFAYSAENQSLYVAYGDNTITKIPLDTNFNESPFANLPYPPLGLSTAGEYIFTVDISGAWESHWTFQPNGELISQKEWNYPSKEFIWNATNRRMYHFRDGTSPNDLHWEEIREDGTLGDDDDSPYHSSLGIQYPIRVSKDGTTVLLGSGRIYDGITLDHINDLSNDILDAIWVGSELFTFKSDVSDTVLQQWNPSNNYELINETTYLGEPLRLFEVQHSSKKSMLIITNKDNKPNFTVIALGDDNDYDNDTILNEDDNCPFVSNTDQEDFDQNEIGDACEGDSDGDGITDDRDNCKVIKNPTQSDADNDDIGDKCDSDYLENDNWLLTVIPSIIASITKEQTFPPEWGVLNTLCCPSSSATLSVRLDNVTLRSTLPSCNSVPTFEGFRASRVGVKTWSASLNSTTCGLIEFRASNEFVDSRRYLYNGEFRNGSPVIVVYSEEITDENSLPQQQNFSLDSTASGMSEESIIRGAKKYNNLSNQKTDNFQLSTLKK